VVLAFFFTLFYHSRQDWNFLLVENVVHRRKEFTVENAVTILFLTYRHKKGMKPANQLLSAILMTLLTQMNIPSYNQKKRCRNRRKLSQIKKMSYVCKNFKIALEYIILKIVYQ
jgi:hypothetical protein